MKQHAEKSVRPAGWLAVLLLAAVAAVAAVVPAAAKEPVYTDAAQLTIINRAQPGGPALERFDVSRYDDLGEITRRYYQFSTGLAVVFRTDSPNIYARWTITDKRFMAGMTLVAQQGLDLYIRRGGEWIFAGAGMPGEGDEHTATVVASMDGSMHECMLYLPLQARLGSLEIGVDEGAVLEAAENPYSRKIVVIGSSVTHGNGSSRPGLAYVARLGRMLGVECANLGSGGQCKVDDYFAHIAADTEADAFIFDVFSNPTAAQIEARLPGFVARVREAHPETPLIFISTLYREGCNFNGRVARSEADKRRAALEGMAAIRKAGYKNIYFIDPGMPMGDDHETSIDGTHPSDLGFDRMLASIRPKIARILARVRRGIRP